jgi:DNA-binding SARP family transcriptional activator
LLAYLALHHHAPQPRQHLAFLFWPDSTEARARANLRNLIHRLRQALPQADQFLHTSDGTLQWQTAAPLTLDVADFEQAIAEADQAEQA